MKTQIQSLTISLLIYSVLFLVLAGMAFGSEMDTNPPIISNTTIQNISFEEEDYVDDIPFDTRSIAESFRLELIMNEIYNNEEEAYIDDIPFNTESIAANLLFEEAMTTDIDFEDEAYVDDIPASVLLIPFLQCNNIAFVK